jgi:hypothetical protein
MYSCDLLMYKSHKRDSNHLRKWGRIWDSTERTRTSPAERGYPTQGLLCKIFLNDWFACYPKQIFIVFNQENMQLADFSTKLVKEKMWESEIRSNPDKRKTPALWVTRSKENLVQDGKDNILPLQDNKYHHQVSNRWKKKPPQVWIFIKWLKT